MFEVIREMLSYPFLVRAILVGLLVSLCASLLGVSLVLKRFSMIGDGLSHVGFGALAIASVANILQGLLTLPAFIGAPLAWQVAAGAILAWTAVSVGFTLSKSPGSAPVE